MRIGIDARLWHYQKAGIGQYVRHLIQELAALDQDDEFVIIQSRHDPTVLATQPNFYRRNFWTPPHNRWEQWTLPMELLPLRLDILHSPDFIPPLFRRCRSVITIHDLAFMRYPHLLTPESERYYGRVGDAVHSADHILAVSQYTKSDLMLLLRVPGKKITVTYHAPDEAFRPISDQAALAVVRQRYHVPEHYVLFVGTIEPRKNLTTLLRVWDRLLNLEERPAAVPALVIAGQKGWNADEVYALKEELNLGQWVQFIGWVGNADLPALYAGAQAFVMPSLYEGFGLPILEAMACGVPVVCSDTSSLPEVAGQAALLVDPEDVDGWVKALRRIFTDATLRQTLVQRGFERVASFSWRQVAETTLEVYRRIVLGEGDLSPTLVTPSEF